VNNRLHFQVYIKEKIHNSSEKKTFGAVLIDIDNFKKINDNFGHGTGDEALKDAVQILKSSLRRDDFIARFGGDEFLVVIDVQTLKMLEDTIARIKDKIEIFNAQGTRPYKLGFSLGYDIYNVQTKMNSDDFIDHLDRLMYEDKHRKLRNTSP
jgi:diguanylate cyclase (GGDEF)-like protein